MSNCKVLQDIKKRIESGMDPDDAIPWEIHCTTIEEYIEVLYYAAQVLPDGRRRDNVKKKLKELLEDVRGTEGEL